MKEYSLYIKSAYRKMKCKDSNEVSMRLIPKEKQALAVTLLVASIPVLVTLITVAFN
jgi:hypothetical protein